MLVLLFWFALIGSVFSYVIYPLILLAFPAKRRAKRPFLEGEQDAPKVSLIVTAHDEESRIREKIQNCLQLDYPNLEILVASDCSTDSTDAIVTEYRGEGVLLARTDEHKGKENAQLQAIHKSSGKILVFSDVATSIPDDAIRRLVHYFYDPSVGAVSSEDRFVSRDGSVAGEGAYVRYEMWLRGLESERAGLVGLSGSFFAARREICEADWDICSPSDFNTALNCARKGLVAVSAPDVLGYYQDVADSSKEYQRKLRTIIRGITALSRHPEVLNPYRFGLFAYQVFGHKLMRWAAPWFQVMFLVLSFILAGKGGVYSLAFFLQLFFYGCFIAGFSLPMLHRYTIIKIPYFFVQVNVAVAHATLSFLTGKRMTVWTPSKR